MTVSMSTVWDRTAEFLSEKLVAVAGIAALTILVPTAIGETLAPLKQPGGASETALALGALTLGLGILSLWGQLVILAMALDPAVDTAGGRAQASRRLGPTIVVALVALLALFVLSLPALGVLIANGVDLARFGQPGAQVNLSPGAGAFVALYGLLMIPVALWLAARFVVLAAPVVVAENQMLGAFGRAWRLSRGLTWRIIGVLLLYLIVLFVATLAAQTVFGSLFALVFQSTSPISAATVLTALVVALVSTIFTVIGTVFPAKLYLAVRDRESAAPA